MLDVFSITIQSLAPVTSIHFIQVLFTSYILPHNVPASQLSVDNFYNNKLKIKILAANIKVLF